MGIDANIHTSNHSPGSLGTEWCDGPQSTWHRLWTGACAILLLCLSNAVHAANIPAPDLVVDQAGVLSAESASILRSKLAEFERVHQTAVVAVLTPSTSPDTIEVRARALAEAWQVGRNYEGRGMVLLLATQDRKYRLEVSRTLATALSNAEAEAILSEHLRPGLQAGRTDAAVLQLLEGLSAHLRQAKGLQLGPFPPNRTNVVNATTTNPGMATWGWVAVAVLLFATGFVMVRRGVAHSLAPKAVEHSLLLTVISIPLLVLALALWIFGWRTVLKGAGELATTLLGGYIAMRVWKHFVGDSPDSRDDTARTIQDSDFSSTSDAASNSNDSGGLSSYDGNGTTGQW